MAIKNISRAEFNRIFTFHSELAPYIGEEFEWYVDDVESVIGTIARGISDSCWSYTILRRNELGDFLVSTLSRDFIDLQTARVVCLRDMAAADVGQEMVLSQRDECLVDAGGCQVAGRWGRDQVGIPSIASVLRQGKYH